MNFKRLNNVLGWLCFLVASTTYILTLEPSVSFWDCGEFISCAYRLQVAHQPGYPLFAMIGKAFSLLSFGDVKKVSYYMNVGSALASGATIMFLFWTITALGRKLLIKKNDILGRYEKVLIMGSGLVGALTFTFTDTFWFSAVETIVFALSALCTSVVFWAILKWDAHSDDAGADKWIIFIAYVIGLSIGIHLLNLLTIPAIVMVYYFRRSKTINTRTAVFAFLTSLIILGLVQYGIRGYTVMSAAYFDLFFVNILNLPFGSGAFAFFIILIILIVFGIWYSIKKNKPVLNLALLSLAFMYFGYSSFAYIPIRATANTDLNNSHPDNAFTLYGYLNRIQYGETPLLTGPYFDAKVIDQTEGSIIYRRGAKNYEQAGRKLNTVYDHTTIIPRMYNTESSDPAFAQDAQFYKEWLHLGEASSPSFGDNLKWMISWQMWQMYGRYFLWNFAGRYNQLDGQQSTEALDGNWTTGVFDAGKHLPNSLTGKNPNNSIDASNAYTPLYALPLLLGCVGLFYQFRTKRKDALIVALLWFFTGIAIVLYVNQPGIQPRERDYSYVGSFYAFAIWIGLGIVGLSEFAKRWMQPQIAAVIITAVGLMLPLLVATKEWGAHNRSTKLIPHDMAYDYLISCPPNAILFTYGDNDTYSLWYDQEVEKIRPDVRIVNLSLFSGDWYIRQMTKKMNASEPLPITMSFEKYKEGVRDDIPFYDKHISGSTDLKEVFDFITSDDDGVKAELQNGDKVNYLPTKKFKLSVNTDELIKNGVITPDQKDKIVDTMKWTYASNFITKDNLAFIDILAHNNWKRPICFTTTVGRENMMSLVPYLYKEGFTYRLIPFKPDTSVSDPMSKTNSLTMYDNIINKFKWGNFKSASYIDPESTTTFYPNILSMFLDLSQNLIKEGHKDLALTTLHRFDAVMPDIYPFIDIARLKYYLVANAYEVNDIQYAKKFTNSIRMYVADQLDYNYYLLQNHADQVDNRTVQIGLSVLNGLVDLGKQYHQTFASAEIENQLKGYENKFNSILGKP